MTVDTAHATHATTINGTVIYGTLSESTFRPIESYEQCDDCGGSEYTTVRREGGGYALKCTGCGCLHHLRPVRIS